MTEQQPSFDAAKYKIAQRDQWNKDADAWHRWNPALDRWVGNVTQKMLDMAIITTGQRILDIAAGAGEPALSAAARVRPEGYVLATDIAEDIIRLAQQVADERGIKQIETRLMDGGAEIQNGTWMRQQTIFAIPPTEKTRLYAAGPRKSRDYR